MNHHPKFTPVHIQSGNQANEEKYFHINESGNHMHLVYVYGPTGTQKLHKNNLKTRLWRSFVIILLTAGLFVLLSLVLSPIVTIILIVLSPVIVAIKALLLKIK